MLRWSHKRFYSYLKYQFGGVFEESSRFSVCARHPRSDCSLALCCGVEEIGSGENSAQLFVPGHCCYLLSRMYTCVGSELANVVGVDEGAAERGRCVASILDESSVAARQK